MRRCDSTCHAAAGPKCVCICGGKYHGISSGKDAGPKNVEEAEAMRPRPKEAIVE